MKTTKKFISGLLAVLAITLMAGCGTGTTKDEQNSTTQNNGAAGSTVENSTADDGDRNDDVNSVTNGTDKDNDTDAGNGAGGSEIDGDGDNVIDDAAQGAEDIGKDIVDGVEDVGEGAADVLDGDDAANDTNGSRDTTTDNSGTKK